MPRDFATRLAMALAVDQRQEGEVAAAAGVAPGQLSRWKSGASTPLVTSVDALVRVLGINGHWLLTGQGDMELREPEKDAVWVAVIGRIVGDQIDMATLKRLAGDEAMTREAREVQRRIKAETARQKQSGGAA